MGQTGRVIDGPHGGSQNRDNRPLALRGRVKHQRPYKLPPGPTPTHEPRPDLIARLLGPANHVDSPSRREGTEASGGLITSRTSFRLHAKRVADYLWMQFYIPGISPSCPIMEATSG